VIEFDAQHIWHPYTSMTSPLPAYAVRSASGVRLTLEDGRELIDGMSSWWCVIHGYNRPELNQAVRDQLEDMAHVMFGGLTHRPAVELSRRLIDLTPDPLDQVFLCDSGSVSVEVAIKMALQYWHNTGHPERSRLLTIRGGYHGDTFGAMAVCDPVNGMHSMFAPVLAANWFAPRPETPFGEALRQGDIDGFRALLAEHRDEIAAVILEPIVQGAGGMWFYSADYLRAVADLCREFDVLLIADEIATGFGRTGRFFACEHADVVPDILCLGKAITGGYMSLGATLTSRRVSEGVCAGGNVLMHGPTFMATPLATATAVASIDLLLASPWKQRVVSIEAQLCNELSQYADHPAVKDVRVLGAIGVVETHEPVDVPTVQRRFVDAGVWIRPFSNLVYLMPPYVIEAGDLSQLTKAVGLAF
jgi:adenosylmethionine-8-amino-7-oxononanoate aminotransferase